MAALGAATTTHNATRCASLDFEKRSVADHEDAAKAVLALDLDGDGDTDVLSASLHDAAVSWFANDGATTFAKRRYTQACFGVDVDGDGDVDALAASRLEDAVTWYENDGARSFARVVVAGADGADAVFALDVDGDGDVDVLAASYNDDTVAWHQQVGGRGWRSFTERAVDEAAGGAAGVFAADVDGDGRADILAAAQDDDRVACPLPSPAPTALLTSVTFEEVGTSLAFREAVFALLVSFVSGVGCIVFCTFLPRARAPDADRSAELVEVAATVRGSGDGAGDPKLVIAVPDDRGAPLANVLLVGGDVGDDLPKSALV
ncbi:hypothetical protein JL720_11986 [Aureococcus anophagefferens]|nr:hypothetical protein JL720_11986 [Aureococcus anophagefferens]